ncbi:NAD(P)H-quinone oxidoreductase subunit 5 [Halomonas campaniensis]|uniref:Probable inorganic carbon transporter subunit DabB n=1 Tax=Halomonas campaniensis TaxID=213554 RepID=A0A7W5K093_9GAMM|nr:NADH-quinone oxidoreductase subunit L [Halomonas campaniensis]MBB3329577.1 NAD(P)H-quinone oxidoreductase subunit 5 [Halomonas campaniensis]
MTTLLQMVVHASLAAWLALPVALLVLAGWCIRLAAPERQQRCWRIGQILMAGSFLASALIGGLLVADAAGVATGLPEAAAPLGLYPDGLAVWMALLISFLGGVLLRFADGYLQGDEGRARFLPWCLVVLASVMLLVFTHHLLVMLVAWVGVSLALHHLLTLYPERVEAQRAAWQKFAVSRLGDLALLAAVLLIYHHYGSFELPVLLAAAEASTGEGWALPAASVALALAALCKCAQLPLHGWLMKVMEAPTPVSALLHAGVINLGGFIWLRLYPLFDGLTPGHLLLIAIGGTTAIVAVLTMLTQASVKHALAWSTCAQMGFMLFEIGLGAYTLALVHLLAHSLYKAHSFLASGRTVRAARCSRLTPAPSRERLLMAGLAGGTAAGVLLAWPELVSHNPVLGALLVLAVGGALLGMPAGLGLRQRLALAAMALALVPLYALLHALVSPALPLAAEPLSPASALLGAAMLMALVGLALAVTLRPHHPAVVRWRIHFRQGLYAHLPLERSIDHLMCQRLPATRRVDTVTVRGEWS